MGERTPIWDTAARGVIFGLSLNHTKGHLVRAMMEAVAYAIYDSFELLLQAGLPIKYPLVLNEGGAVSKLWRQIITDVFNVPTVLVQRRTGAPYGDAILAGVATGVLPNFDVAKQWAQYVAQMDPDGGRHARYMEYFASISPSVRPRQGRLPGPGGTARATATRIIVDRSRRGNEENLQV